MKDIKHTIRLLENTSSKLLVFSILNLCLLLSESQNLQATDSLKIQLEKRLDSLNNIDYSENYRGHYNKYQEIIKLAYKNECWEIYLLALIKIQRVCQDLLELDKHEYYTQITQKFILQHKDRLSHIDKIDQILFNYNYNTAWYYFTLGDFSTCLTQLNNTLAQLKENVPKDSISIFTVLDLMGKSYLRSGDYQNAEAYFEESQAWIPYKTSGDFKAKYRFQYTMIAQSHIGLVYYKQNRAFPSPKSDSLAYLHLKKVLTEIESREYKKSYKNLLITNYDRIAELFQSRHEMDSALYYLYKSLSLENKESHFIYLNYRKLGNAYLDQAQYDKALDYYQKALIVLKKTYKNNHYRIGQALHGIGNVYQTQNYFPQALNYYQKALVQIVPSFNDSTDIAQNPKVEQGENFYEQLLLEVLNAKAKTLAALFYDKGQVSDLKKALNTYKQAARLAQRMQQGLQDIESKLFLSEQIQTIYQGAIKLAYEAHCLGVAQNQPLEELYYYMELNKASILRESFQDTHAQNHINLPDSLQEQEASINRKRFLLKEKLQSALETPEKNRDKITKLKKQLFELQQSLEKLQAFLREKYPEYHSLKFGAPHLSIGETQQSLQAKNSILVEYFFGQDVLYILGLSGKEVVLEEVPWDPKLQRVLARFVQKGHADYYFDYNTIRNASEAFHHQFTEDAHFLYRTLLASVLEKCRQLGQKKLIIVPDGQVSYLPFDILLTEAARLNGPSYAQLPFLIKKYTIQYGFSATFLFKNLLGKPKTQPKMANYCGFAPLYGNARKTPKQARRGRAWNPREKVSYLHFNKAEVSNAQKVMGGRGFYDHQATKQNFLDYAGRARVIHLSMHAFVDEQKAHSAGLLFSKDSSTYEFLSLYELYGIKLHADLAVLSACETGQGQFVRGAGVMSLGHTFRYTGCSSIVMSHWPADDETAAALMKQYFWHLKKGKNKDEALQAAKLDFLEKAGSLSHPYFWANFVFIGEEEAISFASPYSYLPWYLLISILVLGTWIFRKRIRQALA